jgi:Ni/Fe-hydrogenase subunit HybB-like protein
MLTAPLIALPTALPVGQKLLVAVLHSSNNSSSSNFSNSSSNNRAKAQTPMTSMIGAKLLLYAVRKLMLQCLTDILGSTHRSSLVHAMYIALSITVAAAVPEVVVAKAVSVVVQRMLYTVIREGHCSKVAAAQQ